jgi:hypothetical protein
VRSFFVLALLGGCAQPAGPEVMIPPAGDPLYFGEKPLHIDRLPGDPPLRWPLGVASSRGVWLLPWQDASGWHVRRISLVGEIDRDLPDEPKALLPVTRGFAAVTADSVLFLDDEGRVTGRQPTGLDGQAASDGKSILVADSASALLVSPGEQLAVELPEPPSFVFGDASGFVLGDYLLSPTGNLARAPAPLVPSTRLYRHSQPGGDRISRDADTWIDAGGTVTWASSDGATAVVGSRVVLGLDEHGMRTRGLLPRSVLAVSPWLTATMGARLVWQAVVGDGDRALVILDGGSLVATGGWVRIPAPFSRAVIVVPGESAILVAWLATDRRVRYAVWTPEIP